MNDLCGGKTHMRGGKNHLRGGKTMSVEGDVRFNNQFGGLV